MRVFPRAVVAAGLLGLLLSFGPTPVPAGAEDPGRLKERHSQIQQQQRQARQDLQRSSQALQRANRQLHASRTRLWAARGQLRTVDARLRRAKTAHRTIAADLAAQRRVLATARADLAGGDRDVAAQEAELRQLIVDGFEAGDPRVSAASGLLGGTITLEELSRFEDYETTLTTTQSNALQELEADLVMLAVREDNVAEATARVAAQEQAAADKVTEIRQLRKQKVAARDRVTRLVRQRQAAQAEAARVRRADRAQLARLQRQEVRLRKKMLVAAAGMGNRRVANLGRLLRTPVVAPVSSPFGMRRHPIYGYRGFHNGTDFAAACGTPLRAGETGRVISRYYSPVWGHRLHLAIGRVNGRGYTLVYNHLARPGLPVGSVVGRGERVGVVGSSGWSTGCHLHFTVLRDGVAVNPLRFM